MMSINHAVLILEDCVSIMTQAGLDKFYLDQIIEAIDCVINALPDDIKSNFDREGYYLQ